MRGVRATGHIVDLNDPNFEMTLYDPFVAYGRSKTANILFAVEFDRRHRDRGVRATAVHPGGIMTELSRHMPDGAIDAGFSKSRNSAGLQASRLLSSSRFRRVRRLRSGREWLRMLMK